MKVAPLVTHTLSASDAGEAYRLLRDDRDSALGVVFDFTGANPPHPYRKGSGAMGQPDPVPRVCMADNPVQAVEIDS